MADELVTDADWVAAHRANALFDAHRDDPEFGYPYLLEECADPRTLHIGAAVPLGRDLIDVEQAGGLGVGCGVHAPEAPRR